jgi:hypothetical protein
VVDTGRSFHVHATTTLEYRVVFPYGCYVVGSAVEHISFSANAPQTLDTTTVQEQKDYLFGGR